MLYGANKRPVFDSGLLSLLGAAPDDLTGRGFCKITLTAGAHAVRTASLDFYYQPQKWYALGKWDHTRASSFADVQNGRDIPYACGSFMKPIWNSKGTCFLNAVLQVLRVLYCIEPVRYEMNVFVPDYSQVNNPGNTLRGELSQAILEFLHGYDDSTADAAHLEALLMKVHNVLQLRDTRLDLATYFLGRTHLTMMLIIEALFAHNAAVLSPTTRAAFNGTVGLILNDMPDKVRFESDVKSRTLSNADRQKLALVNDAQSEGNYVVMLIARALGLSFVLDNSLQFKWPEVLIISTTRWDKNKQRYVKVKDQDLDLDPAAALQTIKPQGQRMTFSRKLPLKQYGFSDAPDYALIGFTGKISGHSLAVVCFKELWWSCSNQEVTILSGGDSAIDLAGRQGYLQHTYFGNRHDVEPEILVYQRAR